jgi:hypothetical protein
MAPAAADNLTTPALRDLFFVSPCTLHCNPNPHTDLETFSVCEFAKVVTPNSRKQNEWGGQRR